MLEVNFMYNNQMKIYCQPKDLLKDIFKKFTTKANIEDKNIFYFFNCIIINNLNQTIEELTNQKSFIIFPTTFENFDPNKYMKIESNEVICPECKCSAFLTIKDYKMNLNCSKNNHKFSNILIKDFSKTQEINNNAFILNSYNYQNGINNNNNFNQGNYICKEHNEKYISYCKTCKKNICLICKNNHDAHEAIEYSKILIKDDKLIKDMDEIRKIIDSFENNINEIIKKLNIVKDNIEEYYRIIYGLINNYIKNKNKNQVILKNIKDIICNNNLINDIKKINNSENKYNNIINIYNKIKFLNIYDEINSLNHKNEIINKSKSYTLIYKISKNINKIKLFGTNFVNNNKNILKLEIKGKEYELMENYIFQNNNDNNELKVKIRGIENVSNMEDMFNECSSLLTLPDISKWNTINVTNMKSIFNECSSLLSLPDISKWNTLNVTNMGNMFSGCSSLSYLPDISKWNTTNVTNMGAMFYGCSSLLSLPDISKWNTTNVIDMGSMFDGCSSLSYLPDISKWNTINVINMGNMFDGCSSLSSLPDISKWNTINVNNMGAMLIECSSLSSLPDISKWNTTNVTEKRNIFYGCLSLIEIPDIFK